MNAPRTQFTGEAVDSSTFDVFSPLYGKLAALPLSYCRFGVVVGVADFILLNILCLGSYFLYGELSSNWLVHPGIFWLMGFACSLAYVLANQAQGLYKATAIMQPKNSIVIVLRNLALTAGLFAVTAFVGKLSPDLSRGAALSFFIVAVGTLPMVRILARKGFQFLMDNHLLNDRRSIVVLGSSRQLAPELDILRKLRRNGYGITRKLEIAADDAAQAERNILRAVTEIRQHLKEVKIHEVFLIFGSEEHAFVDMLIDNLRTLPVPVRLLLDSRTSDLLHARALTDLGPAKSVLLQTAVLTEWQWLTKRTFDLTLSLAGLFLLAPLLVLIALCVALDSPGPVLFRQRRAGESGRVFRIYKFRSMTTLDDGAVIRQATRNDQRVTSVGAFLRKTSLDELPQLLNVIKGDMSLVGPRPHALAHDAEYSSLIEHYDRRQHLKPGITGWAQVHGCRGETANIAAMEKRVKYDLWYIKNWSLLLDVRIIIMTILQVSHFKNVY